MSAPPRATQIRCARCSGRPSLPTGPSSSEGTSTWSRRSCQSRAGCKLRRRWWQLLLRPHAGQLAGSSTTSWSPGASEGPRPASFTSSTSARTTLSRSSCSGPAGTGTSRSCALRSSCRWPSR
eukprot:8887535-Pyramimonas_sp.AAC.1